MRNSSRNPGRSFKKKRVIKNKKELIILKHIININGKPRAIANETYHEYNEYIKSIFKLVTHVDIKHIIVLSGNDPTSIETVYSSNMKFYNDFEKDTDFKHWIRKLKIANLVENNNNHVEI